MVRALTGALLIGLVAASVGVPASAETPPSFEEFTFRKVAPPTGGAVGRRITIQIDPEEQARRLAPPKPPAPEEQEEADDVAALPLPVDDPFRGFWTAISPRIEDASPARLDTALLALDTLDALAWPRLDDMRKITDRYGRDILRETVGRTVSPALVAAIISVESSGRTDAVSSAGASGLMQLMPATAERFGVKDREKPDESIRGGVRFLEFLMEEFGRDPLMILAGYNAGEGAVRQHGGVPPYAETRAYVPKVLAAFRVASGLCRTPPQLISDGCVFVGPDS